MPAPIDIPGFYYDSEKNRYFPIKGPIPGSKKRPKLEPCSSSSSSPNKEVKDAIKKGERIKASKLIDSREIQGRDIFLNSKKILFKDQYEKLQTSKPVVWHYDYDYKVADSAIELVRGKIQTSSGLRDASFLATASTNGALRLFALCNLLDDSEYGEILPKPRRSHSEASGAYFMHLALSSGITCIKYSSQSTQNHAFMVTTLGSGRSKGLVLIWDLNDVISRCQSSCPFRTISTLEDTIWTADLNPNGTHAIVGLSDGAGLVNVENGHFSSIYRGKSAVLSQRYIGGNVALCGLRNGLIRVIDLRENARTRNERNRALNSSNSLRMPSAVCSLVSLVSDENYFLGSSMDGSINLFDMRATRNGGVQSYDGHVNSHTRLQLAVNPSETLFTSGGQDCGVRIWSIKSGELLFSDIFSDSPVTSACWPDLQGRFGIEHSWGAWLGSRSGLFYMHGT